MYGVIVGLIIFIALLLVLVVLAQNPKGGGLSSQFGGSGATQVMGVKKTGDILERLTWGLAIAILVLTLATNFFIPEPTEFLESPNIDRASEQNVLPPTIQPPLDDNAVAPIDDLGLTDDSADTTN